MKKEKRKRNRNKEVRKNKRQKGRKKQGWVKTSVSSTASARNATDAGGVEINLTYITLYTLSHHILPSAAIDQYSSTAHASVKARTP